MLNCLLYFPVICHLSLDIPFIPRISHKIMMNLWLLWLELSRSEMLKKSKVVQMSKLYVRNLIIGDYDI